jgi:hypothetical protein
VSHSGTNPGIDWTTLFLMNRKRGKRSETRNTAGKTGQIKGTLVQAYIMMDETIPVSLIITIRTNECTTQRY